MLMQVMKVAWGGGNAGAEKSKDKKKDCTDIAALTNGGDTLPSSDVTRQESCIRGRVFIASFVIVCKHSCF